MKQNTLYSAVANFINSIGPGNTYTSDDFKKALDKETQYLKRSWMGQWYRVRTYQTYLGASGLITKVRKGQWRVNYRIPEWMSLSALETLRGYRDCVYDSRTGKRNTSGRGRRSQLKLKLEQYKHGSKIQVGTVYTHIGDKHKIEYKITGINPDSTTGETMVDIRWKSVNTGRIRMVTDSYSLATIQNQLEKDYIRIVKTLTPIKTGPKAKATQPTATKNPFKVGDKVTLKTLKSKIYNQTEYYAKQDGLKVGETYTVTGISSNGRSERDGWRDSFIRLQDALFAYPYDVFELYAEPKKTSTTAASQSKPSPTTTWRVGDILTKNELNTGAKYFFGYRPNAWTYYPAYKERFFIGDRQIEKIELKGESLAARISGTLDKWVAVDSLPQSPIDMIRQVPEDRLPAFIAELETLIKKYK